MKMFKLILSEKRGFVRYEGIHKKFIKAENRDTAYNKALRIAATFFNNYKNAPVGIPDKDFIFWFNGDYAAIWINSLEELNFI